MSDHSENVHKQSAWSETLKNIIKFIGGWEFCIQK